jgi:hypothetical protein
MNNLLTNIGEALMAVNFVALLLILMLKQSRTAFEVIVFATLLLGISHLTLEYQLYQFSKEEGSKEFVRAAWYLGFSSTYLVHIVACAFYCSKKRLIRDRSSSIILIAFLIAAVIQVSRYIDRFVFETDVLGGLYTNGIPAINSICTIVTVLYVASKYAASGKLGKSLFKYKITSPAMRSLVRWTAA